MRPRAGMDAVVKNKAKLHSRKIMRRLNSGTAHCHSVQNLLSSTLLSKT